MAEQKAALQQNKADLAAQIQRLDEAAKKLVARYEALHAQQIDLETMPTEIAALEEEVAMLRQSEAEHQDEDDADREPHLRLPLDQTLELLAEREVQNQLLDEELEALRARLPERNAEMERLERGLKPLEQQKISAIAAAKEARKRKEDGGMDELEGKGRWWSACGRGLEAWVAAEG